MPIIALIGPSGAGKSTLVDYYIKQHPDARLHKSITTRPVRGDSDTSHRFVSDEEFDRLAAAGELIKPVEAFGYRYAITKIPDYDGITFVLLRYQFVEEFKLFYPEAKVIQVEAPVGMLLERSTSRGGARSENTDMLQAEISAGRKLAKSLVKTHGDFFNTYKEFEDLCATITHSTV